MFERAVTIVLCELYPTLARGYRMNGWLFIRPLHNCKICLRANPVLGRKFSSGALQTSWFCDCSIPCTAILSWQLSYWSIVWAKPFHIPSFLLTLQSVNNLFLNGQIRMDWIESTDCKMRTLFWSLQWCSQKLSACVRIRLREQKEKQIGAGK